jgi:hypothetical protein
MCETKTGQPQGSDWPAPQQPLGLSLCCCDRDILLPAPSDDAECAEAGGEERKDCWDGSEDESELPLPNHYTNLLTGTKAYQSTQHESCYFQERTIIDGDFSNRSVGRNRYDVYVISGLLRYHVIVITTLRIAAAILGFRPIDPQDNVYCHTLAARSRCAMELLSNYAS